MTIKYIISKLVFNLTIALIRKMSILAWTRTTIISKELTVYSPICRNHHQESLRRMLNKSMSSSRSLNSKTIQRTISMIK
jgi:hypothetical protein